MIYVLYGEEHYLIQKELVKIIDRHVTFEKDMNTSFFDASKNTMDEIIADAYTVPFFSEEKVIVITHSSFLGSVNDSTTDINILERYLDHPSDTTVLVMIYEAEKLDQRKKIVKRLSKEAKILKFSLLDEYERGSFVKKECDSRGMRFEREALQEFYYRCGFSPSRIQNELDKLSLYNLSIKKEDVIALVTRPLEENVFDLFQFLIQKKFTKAYHLWKDFESQNIDPIALIAMLASQYRFLYQVNILYRSGYTKKEIASELNAHPYRVEKTLESTRLCTAKEALSILHDLSLLDQNIKAGKIDKSLGLELFLIKRGK